MKVSLKPDSFNETRFHRLATAMRISNGPDRQITLTLQFCNHERY